MNGIYLRRSVFIICFFVWLGLTVGCSGSGQPAALAIGSGMFTVEENSGVNADGIRVFYYRPANWTPDSRIVIVQHGVQRNAQEYRDGWEKYADEYNLLVVCPEFSNEKYPGAHFYNLGNMTDSDTGVGMLQSKDKWIFPVIDHVFNEVRIRSGSTRDTFVLFGHGAGAQLVHRYALFAGKTQASRIIFANAGWYTMLGTEAAFPYGLENMPLSKEDLAKAFAKPIVIMLGESDTRQNHKVLRHTPEADSQGLTRFERGNRFFNEAKARAVELGVPFNWQLITVPGVGHSDSKMAATAAKLIADDSI